MNLRRVDTKKTTQRADVSGSAKRGVSFQEKWLRIRFSSVELQIPWTLPKTFLYLIPPKMRN